MNEHERFPKKDKKTIDTIHACIFTYYIYHKNQPNVGKNTIHGWYGKGISSSWVSFSGSMTVGERERESKTARPCCPAPLNLKCVYLCFLQNTNKLRWVLIPAKSTLLDSLNSKKKHSQLQKVALSNMEKHYMFNLKTLIQTSQEHNGIWLTSTSTFKANSWRFLLRGPGRNSWVFHSWENVMWRVKILERLYDFGSWDAFHMSPYVYRKWIV